jgi:hypothetical protein
MHPNVCRQWSLGHASRSAVRKVMMVPRCPLRVRYPQRPQLTVRSNTRLTLPIPAILIVNNFPFLLQGLPILCSLNIELLVGSSILICPPHQQRELASVPSIQVMGSEQTQAKGGGSEWDGIT